MMAHGGLWWLAVAHGGRGVLRWLVVPRGGPWWLAFLVWSSLPVCYELLYHWHAQPLCSCYQLARVGPCWLGLHALAHIGECV
jgi:hypothetical protein